MTLLNLSADCLITRGISRGIIVDLARNEREFLSLQQIDLIEKSIGKPRKEVVDNFCQTCNEEGLIFLGWLEKKEFIHWLDKSVFNQFSRLDLRYESPVMIENCIIDICDASEHNYAHYFHQLTLLNCKDLQLRFYDELSLTSVGEILSKLEFSSIKSVEILMKYYCELSLNSLLELTANFKRVSRIIVYSAPSDKHILSRTGIGNIQFVKQKIPDESHCGFISPSYFSIDLKLFSESIHYNTCLNKKLSIHKDGSIRNCPAMKSEFGAANNSRFHEVIQDRKFKKLWNIKKSQLDVCKTCEFRNICTDCRAFVGNPAKDKPLRCTYNPITMKW